MPDVLLGGADRKPVAGSLPLPVEPRWREARPPPCRACCGASWWNGWRVTYPVVASATDTVTRLDLMVPRAKCSRCHRGFTCYPAGIYPRRQYQLDVVAEMAAAVALGGASVVDAAAASSAGPTSVRRWMAWIAALAEVEALHAVAAKIDPSTATVATTPPQSRTAAVLDAFEVLAAALVRGGIAFVERTGLGRVLGWQHRAHGDVLGLVAGPRRFSPAMAHGGRPDGR